MGGRTARCRGKSRFNILLIHLPYCTQKTEDSSAYGDLPLLGFPVTQIAADACNIVMEVTANTGGTSVHLLSHDWGCLIAYEMVERDPTLFATHTAVDVGPLNYKRTKSDNSWPTMPTVRTLITSLMMLILYQGAIITAYLIFRVYMFIRRITVLHGVTSETEKNHHPIGKLVFLHYLFMPLLYLRPLAAFTREPCDLLVPKGVGEVDLRFGALYLQLQWHVFRAAVAGALPESLTNSFLDYLPGPPPLRQSVETLKKVPSQLIWGVGFNVRPAIRKFPELCERIGKSHYIHFGRTKEFNSRLLEHIKKSH